MHLLYYSHMRCFLPIINGDLPPSMIAEAAAIVRPGTTSVLVAVFASVGSHCTAVTNGLRNIVGAAGAAVDGTPTVGLIRSLTYMLELEFVLVVAVVGCGLWKPGGLEKKKHMPYTKSVKIWCVSDWSDNDMALFSPKTFHFLKGSSFKRNVSKFHNNNVCSSRRQSQTH